MGNISSSWSHLRFSLATKNQPSQTLDSPSSLLNLPPEILLEIGRLLPISAAASLTLTCRHIYRVLGSQYFTSLTAVEVLGIGERVEFLQFLERDILRFIFCHYCTKLHYPGKYGPLNSRPCHGPDALHLESSLGPANTAFRYQNIRMAMKRHLLGLDISNTLRPLSQTDVFSSKRDTFGKPTIYVFWDATQTRIIGGKVLVRAQRWIRLPQELDLTAVWFNICPHLQSCDLEDLLYCRYNHYRQGTIPCEPCMATHQCKHCHTDYQIDVRVLQSRVHLVTICWKDLGNAESPLTVPWAPHFYNLEGWNQADDRTIELFPVGSIRATFERQELDKSFKATRFEEMEIQLRSWL